MPESIHKAAGQTPVSHLLYLHGFRSSPMSTKSRQMAAWLSAKQPQVVWLCPQQPPSPSQTLAMLGELTANWPAASSAVVGSSLGGFYATAIGEARHWRTVLINPAVDPARSLADKIGSTTMWHSDDSFEFRAEYVDELRRMTPGKLANLDQTMALIAKGDEVLDWRAMHARYLGSHLTLVEGSDHAFSEFEQQLPSIGRFLGWPAPN